MIEIKRILILVSILLGGSFFLANTSAKTKSNAIDWRKKTIKKERIPIDTLLKNYLFDKAIVEAEDLINEAKEKELPTDSLNILLKKARKGANMLRGTEKIIVVDSLVIAKKDVLNAIKTSKETGKIGQLIDFIKQNNIDCPNDNTTFFINDFNDKAYLSLSNKDSILRLNETYKINNKWTTPKPLKGLEGIDTDQNYPFMTQDGVTLYYSAKGEESLGGYDIFVTRYNTDTEKFVHPENVGMPYNSLANDYLMIIDEYSNLGWFVSDRYQPKDTACIYTFIPNTIRILVQNILTDTTSLITAAQLRSIKNTWYDKEKVEEAQTRIRMLANDNGNRIHNISKHFILNDSIVYTSIQNFKSDEARKLASQYIHQEKQLNKKKYSLEQFRVLYKRTNLNKRILLKDKIIHLEKEIEENSMQLKALEKKIRQLEIIQCTKKE